VSFLAFFVETILLPIASDFSSLLAIKEFERHYKNKPRRTKQEVQRARLQASEVSGMRGSRRSAVMVLLKLKCYR
jgi:hypothetical protein